jgi:hypothetical protein
MGSGPYQSPQSIIDFTTRYLAELNVIVGNRMRELGIPDDMIGIRSQPGLDEGALARQILTDYRQRAGLAP